MLKLASLISIFLLCLMAAAEAKKFDQNSFILDEKKTQLKEDEGYLLIHLRNYEYVSRVVFEGTKDKLRFKKIPAGNNFAVVKVKAGHYFPFLIRFEGAYSYRDYRPDETAYGFEVKAGKLNYPGSWISDLSRTGFNFYNFNKSASVYEKVRGELPGLFATYSFTYTGRYPDPYIDHLSTIKAHKDALGIASSDYTIPGIDSVLPIYTKSQIEVFNKADGTDSIKSKYPLMESYYSIPANGASILNPQGTHLLRVTFKDDDEFVEIMDLKSAKSYVVYGGNIGKNATIKNIEWISDNSFYFTVAKKYDRTNLVAKLTLGTAGEVSEVDFIDLPGRGYLIDVLTAETDHLLFSYYPNTHRRAAVYKINVADQQSADMSLKKSFYHNKKFKGAEYWVTDTKGRLRFAANYNPDEETIEYWFLPEDSDGEWRLIKSFDKDDESLAPIALTGDNQSFFVITDEHSDTNGVYRYSTNDFSLQETVFEEENVDVTSLIFDDETSQIVGVRHLVDGKSQVIYLNQRKSHWLNEIQKDHPDLILNLIQLNKISNTALLFGTNSRSKGAHYLYQFEGEELKLLYETSPAYEQLEKGISHVIKTTSADGLELEGYLMMPKNSQVEVPMVVMPHGGPMGVRDDASNDATQHFYAYHGIATLKVNFRGSGGFGKKFKEMGQLEWGKKIEKDIHQVVQQAIADYPINADKICAAGFSYGGYSSLMLTILYPEQYQCAVSSAGVTDIPLLFTSSDTSHHKPSLERLQAYAGNPKEQLQDMMARSPVYLANKATNPILLIHGFKDLRVSLEHSIRFKQVMEEVERPVDLLVLADEFHSLNHIESRMKHTEASLDFIKQQLALD